MSGMERLKFMQGSWVVDAFIMGETGHWEPTHLPNETHISPIFNGQFHRETMPIAYGDEIVNLFFSWSYDKFRGVYRMLSCDDSSGLMSIMEGDFIEGTDTVSITDVRSGTSLLQEDGSTSFSRLSSTKDNQNQFTDLVEESLDEGKTWSPIFRAIHYRKDFNNAN